MNKKKVCIIGGGGFIGHNLALYLKKLNFDLLVVDSLSVNNLYSLVEDNLPNPNLAKYLINSRIELFNKNDIGLIVQDARDYHALSKIIDNFKPDVLIHLAAVSHSTRSNKDPFSTFDHSLRTLENSLDNAKNRVEHFIRVCKSSTMS